MVLRVSDLHVTLPGRRGAGAVVRGLSFAIEKGRTLGIVGESGAGKSMTALAVMGLLPEGARVGGRIEFEGANLLEASEKQLSALRGNRIGMVFQETLSALNPVHPIGRQIMEPLRLHRRLGRRAAREVALTLLAQVGLPDPAARFHAYPHQLSGGQRQRVMIAIALACGPALLIADEPTTALDVTVQAEILALIRDLARAHGMAVLLISHDISVVASMADDIIVMYAGRAVERGAPARLFETLAHPYSRGLLAAVPRLGAGRERRLAAIPGVVPAPQDLPPGCAFADRCAFATDACRVAEPALVEVASGHAAACIHVERVRRAEAP